MFRRTFLSGLLPVSLLRGLSRPQIKITGMDVVVVKVNVRGNWVLLKLKTDQGLTRLGEASQGVSQDAAMRAALAELNNAAIAPHNPSGPVATAASVQLCAGIPNFAILEHAWGEASWSKDLIVPPEEFRNGRIRVPTAPGLGIELNEKTVAAHAA